jgi:hypothetical protein
MNDLKVARMHIPILADINALRFFKGSTNEKKRPD